MPLPRYRYSPYHKATLQLEAKYVFTIVRQKHEKIALAFYLWIHLKLEK